MKSVCSQSDIMTAYSMVEDSGIIQLLEKDMGKVKFPLESPSMLCLMMVP